MKVKYLIPMLFLVLFIGSAMAANPSAINLGRTEYSGVCIKTSWSLDETSAADFDINGFNITASSNNSEFNDLDVNIGPDQKRYAFCTVSTGDYVNFTITPFDSNRAVARVDDDANWWIGEANSINFQVPTAVQGGFYLVFKLFAGVGAIIILVILLAAIILVVTQLGLKGIIGGKS